MFSWNKTRQVDTFKLTHLQLACLSLKCSLQHLWFYFNIRLTDVFLDFLLQGTWTSVFFKFTAFFLPRFKFLKLCISVICVSVIVTHRRKQRNISEFNLPPPYYTILTILNQLLKINRQLQNYIYKVSQCWFLVFFFLLVLFKLWRPYFFLIFLLQLKVTLGHTRKKKVPRTE